METKQLKVLLIEIFKTVSNVNATFMKDTCQSKINARERSNNITVRHHISAPYRDKILMTLGPKI